VPWMGQGSPEGMGWEVGGVRVRDSIWGALGSWVMVWELLGDGAQIRVFQGQGDGLDLGCC